MIAVALVINLQGLHDFHHRGGQGQWRADFVRGVEGVGEVLDVQIDSKARVELASGQQNLWVSSRSIVMKPAWHQHIAV